MRRLIILPEELQIISEKLEKIEATLKKEQKQIEDPILTTEDVMNLMKVSRRSLQTWRDEGLIEFSTIKGKFYYRLSAINSLLNKNVNPCIQ